LLKNRNKESLHCLKVNTISLQFR